MPHRNVPTCKWCGQSFYMAEDFRDHEPCHMHPDEVAKRAPTTIDRASLPPLPDGWKPPFKVEERWESRRFQSCVIDADGETVIEEDDRSQFLAALLNACYPVGGK